MEKTMSVEERIRRAEERYNMKNGKTSRVENRYNKNNWQNSNSTIKENASTKKKNRKKLLMQIFVCLVIYVAFYAITNREYIFSDNFKKDVNTFFTEKTKLYEIYMDARTYVENNILKNNSETNGQNEENTTEATEEQKQEDTNTEILNEQNTENLATETNNQNTEGVGGAEDNVSNETVVDENAQMQQDAEKIKSTISFINPIEGRITSTFGWRNPTVSTVPKYHTGLDIAATSGTVIKSATDGKVILASSEGDYGNHYQIQINDVIIIYAHCQKLYLKEGDTVVQGQEIAEVGSTGNSTGPHLHFEIRIEDRKVDPQLILDI